MRIRNSAEIAALNEGSTISRPPSVLPSQKKQQIIILNSKNRTVSLSSRLHIAKLRSTNSGDHGLRNRHLRARCIFHCPSRPFTPSPSMPLRVPVTTAALACASTCTAFTQGILPGCRRGGRVARCLCQLFLFLFQGFSLIIAITAAPTPGDRVLSYLQCDISGGFHVLRCWS